MKKLTSRQIRRLDGGFYSRKLWFAIGTSFAILLVGCMAAWWPAFAVSIEVVVGGLIGSLAIFMGGNVGSKLALGKAAQPQAVNPKEEDEEL